MQSNQLLVEDRSPTLQTNGEHPHAKRICATLTVDLIPPIIQGRLV
jgi:hypothetical protein